MGHSVREAYGSHRGYASDKWESYLDVYERHFSAFRGKEPRVLEIGVQNGGSLQVWKEYFGRGSFVVGCDINPAVAELDCGDQIEIVVGDITSADTFRGIQTLVPEFDIIIDDGSHRSGDIIRTFDLLFPLLSCGGVYLAEDLACSYWRSYEGRVLGPFSSIEFFKRLVDVVNLDHWGSRSRSRLLSRILEPFAMRRLERLPLGKWHSEIYSVHFYNAICVIEKARRPTGIGERITSGVEATVEASVVRVGKRIGSSG